MWHRPHVILLPLVFYFHVRRYGCTILLRKILLFVRDPKRHVDTHGGPSPLRRAAAHAPSTRHTRDAPPPHASTRHTTLHHARTDHNTAHSTPLHCKTPIMRQNTTSQSTEHAARGPAGPIVRPAATRLRAPSPRAHIRACAPAHRSYSTNKAPATVRGGPPRAHSTHCTRSHATFRSPRASRHALPSLPSAQHAHTPARARAVRERNMMSRSGIVLRHEIVISD